MLYVTNHDQNWNESKKTLTEKYGANRYPLTILAYTLYGMPLIYNGQEVGGNQALNYFTDTKINWTAKDDKMHNTIRTLTALKHAVPALHDKTPVNWVTLSPSNSNVLAYTRKEGDSEILVVLNMATEASTATLTGLTAGDWSLWLNSETIAQGTSRQQQTFSATQTISLEAKGYRVYVKGTFSEEGLPATSVNTLILNRPMTIGPTVSLVSLCNQGDQAFTFRMGRNFTPSASPNRVCQSCCVCSGTCTQDG